MLKADRMSFECCCSLVHRMFTSRAGYVGHSIPVLLSNTNHGFPSADTGHPSFHSKFGSGSSKVWVWNVACISSDQSQTLSCSSTLPIYLLLLHANMCESPRLRADRRALSRLPAHAPLEPSISWRRRRRRARGTGYRLPVMLGAESHPP